LNKYEVYYFSKDGRCCLTRAYFGLKATKDGIKEILSERPSCKAALLDPDTNELLTAWHWEEGLGDIQTGHPSLLIYCLVNARILNEVSDLYTNWVEHQRLTFCDTAGMVPCPGNRNV